MLQGESLLVEDGPHKILIVPPAVPHHPHRVPLFPDDVVDVTEVFQFDAPVVERDLFLIVLRVEIPVAIVALDEDPDSMPAQLGSPAVSLPELEPPGLASQLLRRL